MGWRSQEGWSPGGKHSYQEYFPEQKTYLASVLQKCSIFRGECNLEKAEAPELHRAGAQE